MSDCRFFIGIVINSLVFRFCFERGHCVTTSAKGIDEYAPRPFDNYLWPEDSIPLPIPDWRGFRKIWKKQRPNLRIRNVCEDTCPECYILKNKFRFAGNNNNNNNNDDSTSLSNDEASNNNSDEDSLSIPSDGSDKENYPYEQIIAEANQHAEEAQQQRRLAKNRQQMAQDEVNNPHESRRFVFSFFFLFSSLHLKAYLYVFFLVIASFAITRRILSCLISGQSSHKTFITSRRSPSTFLGLPT